MTGPKLAEHTSSVLRLWQGIQDLKQSPNDSSAGSPATIILNGDDLTISHLVACARHAATASISTSPDLANRLQRSVDALSTYLNKDRVVYGVNTGFGGSADVRTNELLDLQIGLLQHTQSAIVTSWDKDPASNSEREPGSVMPPENPTYSFSARLCSADSANSSAPALAPCACTSDHGFSPSVALVSCVQRPVPCVLRGTQEKSRRRRLL